MSDDSAPATGRKHRTQGAHFVCLACEEVTGSPPSRPLTVGRRPTARLMALTTTATRPPGHKPNARGGRAHKENHEDEHTQAVLHLQAACPKAWRPKAQGPRQCRGLNTHTMKVLTPSKKTTVMERSAQLRVEPPHRTDDSNPEDPVMHTVLVPSESRSYPGCWRGAPASRRRGRGRARPGDTRAAPQSRPCPRQSPPPRPWMWSGRCGQQATSPAIASYASCNRSWS